MICVNSFFVTACQTELTVLVCDCYKVIFVNAISLDQTYKMAGILNFLIRKARGSRSLSHLLFIFI